MVLFNGMCHVQGADQDHEWNECSHRLGDFAQVDLMFREAGCHSMHTVGENCAASGRLSFSYDALSTL